MKAAQLGLSTMEIFRTFWRAKNQKLDCIYILPTFTDVQDFAGGKVNRIIDNNPILQEWVQDKDSTSQKRVGKNTIYYRGCFDTNTEILTDSGWKNHKEIKIGMGLPTFNLETKEIEQDIIRNITSFYTEEDMVSLQSNTFDVLMTKDHRCVVEDRKTGKLRIKSATNLVSSSSASVIPLRTKGFLNKKGSLSPSLAAVLGWVISEGSYWTEKYKTRFVKKDGTISPKVYIYDRVSICQKKYVKEVRSALVGSGITWYEKKDKKSGCIRFELSRDDSKLIRSYIPTKEFKMTLLDSLDYEGMERIFESLMMGDGYTGNNRATFYQLSKETTDTFQALCVLLGKNARVTLKTFKEKHSRFSHKPIYNTQIKLSKRGNQFKKTLVPYKGLVWCPTTRNSTVISRRNGKVFLTGQSWNERQALMISADWLILDEFDRCKQEVLEQYESRLQHSKHGYKSIFSNPSIPDFGVHKYFKQTDQKKWFVKHKCGNEILLDEMCINYEKEIFQCPQCKEEISDEERRKGEWKATAEGQKGWSGYWLPLWINPRVTAKNIAEYKRSKTTEYFSNFVAGVPFMGGGNKVSASTIIGCLSSKTNSQEDRIIIGVDTGLPIHYVLANKQGYFYYGKCSDPSTGKDPYKELETLLLRFGNSILISDQGGDLIGIRNLQAKFPGRVFLVWYRRDAKNTGLITWGKDTEYGKVIADRNRLIQLFIDEMTDKRITFNGTESDWQEYISHWLNIYRSWEENSLGVKEFKWERTGPDHFVHASIYARIGLDKYAESQAKIINADIYEGMNVGRIFRD